MSKDSSVKYYQEKAENLMEKIRKSLSKEEKEENRPYGQEQC